MKIEHHVDPSTLMSYAAGSLPEVLSAVVAAHLDRCPQCASELHKMERIGATLFEHLEPVPVTTGFTETCLEAAQKPLPVAEEEKSAGSNKDTLARLLGHDISEVHWKRLGFGIWHFPIHLSPSSKGDLRLIKVAPGMVLPEHGHGGSELTLVLSGSYKDEFGSYHAGDISDLGDDVEHRPVSDPNEGCVCLIASEKKARFKDIFARMFQPLTGL